MAHSHGHSHEYEPDHEHDEEHDELQRCIEECLNCHAVCTMTAQYCLTEGGEHADVNIIGVLLDRTYAGEGAQVENSSGAVTQDGPADKAGVQAGDVIVSFEGKPIRTPDQLIVSIRARAVGETVTLTIERDGQRRDLQMTLEAQPDE